MARAMKDSGIEWIGEIPEGWISRKCNSVLCANDGGVWGADPLGTESDKIVIRSTEQTIDGKWSILDPAKRNLEGIDCSSSRIRNGDLLITKSSGSPSHIGKTTIADAYFDTHECYFSNFIQRIRTESYSSKLLWYVFNSPIARDQFVFQQNTTSGIGNINAAIIRNIYIPIPPREEQMRIVGFLDTECARIDAVIEKTRASIEEYKKLKQSVITQAVTKGIRPGRKMKDSGVEWIGYVPDDWKVAKIKYFSSIRSGITLGKTYPKEARLVEYPYLRVANVQGSYTDLSDIATIFVTEAEAQKYQLHDGELLMTEGGDRDKLGRGTVWHAEIDPCLHQNHVFALRTDDRLSAEYVSYLTTSFVGRDYFDVTANQSVHLASTNSTTIMNFKIPVPSIGEQEEIIAFLNSKADAIDTLIERKKTLLSELDAYKKSLIFEYVTGKREVV